MFTQCPKCSATFKITAKQLQQANGKVRCGKCNHIYDALSSLDAEQNSATRPEWLNDPEEGRAQEIQAEIIEIERSGNYKTLSQPETNRDELAEADDEHVKTDVAIDPDIVSAIENEEPSPDSIEKSILNEESTEATLDDSINDEGAALDEDEERYQDTVVDAKDADDLELNAPKQKWGKLFSGSYKGPIIDSVGPLDEAPQTSDHNNDVTTEHGDNNHQNKTDLVNPDNSDSDTDDALNSSMDLSSDHIPLDGLEDLLDGESESLQTYNDLNDELIAEDEETAEETLSEIDKESDSIQPQGKNHAATESDDETSEHIDIDAASESLRNAIDSLTMEKVEWHRLLEAADNDTGSVYMVEKEDDENETQDYFTETADNEPSNESDDDIEKDAEEADQVDQYTYIDNSESASVITSDYSIPTEADLSETPLWANNIDETENTSGTRRWIAIAFLILLLILLGIQVIHYKRETLATDPAYGETIRNVYAALDRPLFPAWSLSAYEIRGYEAISGENDKDVLDIRAQLAVTGDRPMGEPQIKLILKDRWGNTVNTWLFAPDQYMRGMKPPNSLIQPGSLIPVHLSITDPGKTVQGVQLEICLRREGAILQCSGED